MTVVCSIGSSQMYLLKQHKQLEMQFHQFRKDRRAFPLAGSIN